MAIINDEHLGLDLCLLSQHGHEKPDVLRCPHSDRLPLPHLQIWGYPQCLLAWPLRRRSAPWTVLPATKPTDNDPGRPCCAPGDPHHPLCSRGVRHERELPFPAIPSLKFPYPSHWKIPFSFPSRYPGMQFLISHPGKRNFHPWIRTGNDSILYNFAHFLSEIDPWYQWQLPLVNLNIPHLKIAPLVGNL